MCNKLENLQEKLGIDVEEKIKKYEAEIKEVVYCDLWGARAIGVYLHDYHLDEIVVFEGSRFLKESYVGFGETVNKYFKGLLEVNKIIDDGEQYLINEDLLDIDSTSITHIITNSTRGWKNVWKTVEDLTIRQRFGNL